MSEFLKPASSVFSSASEEDEHLVFGGPRKLARAHTPGDDWWSGCSKGHLLGFVVWGSYVTEKMAAEGGGGSAPKATSQKRSRRRRTVEASGARPMCTCLQTTLHRRLLRFSPGSNDAQQPTGWAEWACDRPHTGTNLTARGTDSDAPDASLAGYTGVC